MQDLDKIAWDDMVLPFQLDRSGIRGRVARLARTLDSILHQHAYPRPVEELLAELTLLAALIGQSIKLRWRLSLQVQGDGPISLLAADYFAPAEPGERAQLRAYASFDADRLDPDAEPHALLGQGHFGVMIDQGRNMRPYQGITPLSGSSLATCAETYFAQSEQLPTRFALAWKKASAGNGAGQWRAGGIMLQRLPQAAPRDAAGGSGPEGLMRAGDILSGDEQEDWRRANLLLDTVEPDELIGPDVSPPDLLIRLFHEENPRVFEAQQVGFGCTCTPQKVADAIAAHRPEEIASMVTESGKITADCQFCGAHYEVDPAEIEASGAAPGMPDAGGDGRDGDD